MLRHPSATFRRHASVWHSRQARTLTNTVLRSGSTVCRAPISTHVRCPTHGKYSSCHRHAPRVSHYSSAASGGDNGEPAEKNTGQQMQQNVKETPADGNESAANTAAGESGSGKPALEWKFDRYKTAAEQSAEGAGGALLSAVRQMLLYFKFGYMERILYLGFDTGEFAQGAHHAFDLVHNELAEAEQEVIGTGGSLRDLLQGRLSGLLEASALASLEKVGAPDTTTSPEGELDVAGNEAPPRSPWADLTVSQLQIVNAAARQQNPPDGAYTMSILVQYVLTPASATSPNWLCEWTFEREIPRVLTDAFDVEDDSRRGRNDRTGDHHLHVLGVQGLETRPAQ